MRGDEKSYVLTGKGPAFLQEGCPETLEGFPEEMARTPAASTVHSGGHFFPLSGGPTHAPGYLSSGWTRQDFSLWSQNYAFCCPTLSRCRDGGLASLTILSVAPKGWNPISVSQPALCSGCYEVNKAGQKVARRHHCVPCPHPEGVHA